MSKLLCISIISLQNGGNSSKLLLIFWVYYNDNPHKYISMTYGKIQTSFIINLHSHYIFGN